VLALPRTGEALAMKDDSGDRVESDEEGYELKEEQVSMALQPLGLEDLPVGFFNAHQDSPERLKGFLTGRLSILRATIRRRLQDVTENARSVLANYEREQVQEVVRHAGRMLHTWIDQNSVLNLPSVHVHDSLMGQIASVYASTVRATIRREGEWPNLSYTHHLGYGARRIAALSLGRPVSSFSDLCRTMQANADYAEAHDLISQSERVLTTSYEELLRKVQIMGQTLFRDALKQDVLFWVECGSEWGQGSGYKGRVAARNAKWFCDAARQELERQLHSLIEKEWHATLNNVSELLDADT